jgi:hypothetical protein
LTRPPTVSTPPEPNRTPIPALTVTYPGLGAAAIITGLGCVSMTFI